mmetsp:Transcript_11243/g.28974  ORF Transcript_11243/g.28974 Transcript_11243/m.28974 type:complete len:200 (-) Transcript_11243:55-654(-)
MISSAGARVALTRPRPHPRQRRGAPLGLPTPNHHWLTALASRGRPRRAAPRLAPGCPPPGPQPAQPPRRPHRRAPPPRPRPAPVAEVPVGARGFQEVHALRPAPRTAAAPQGGALRSIAERSYATITRCCVRDVIRRRAFDTEARMITRVFPSRVPVATPCRRPPRRVPVAMPRRRPRELALERPLPDRRFMQKIGSVA